MQKGRKHRSNSKSVNKQSKCFNPYRDALSNLFGDYFLLNITKYSTEQLGSSNRKYLLCDKMWICLTLCVDMLCYYISQFSIIHRVIIYTNLSSIQTYLCRVVGDGVMVELVFISSSDWTRSRVHPEQFTNSPQGNT